MIQIKKSVIIIFLLICGISAFAQTYQSVTMTVGETKTLYLPSSVTSKNLKSCNFYAASPEYADIKYHSAYSVTVTAKKALSTAVIIRCDYTYYVLVGGRYIYGGIGAYDFRITVKDVPVASITLPRAISLDVGQSKQLSPTISPSNAKAELTWYSSNPAIVSVNQNGIILANKAGYSVITVTTANGKSASCTVTSNEVIPDLVLSDKQNAPTLPAKANVSYKRTFSSGWNSLCVPFAVKASYIKGCKLAVVKDKEIRGADKYFSFTTVDEVAAGTPCLVWVPQDTECNIQLKEQNLVKTPVNTGIMKGSFSKIAIGAGCYKLTSDGSSFSITSGDNATVTAYRTYIKLQ